MQISDQFRRFASRFSTVAGSPYAFGTAIFLLVIWGLLGPQYQYSDTWQLIINTGTTIVTFLMVFLIQNTQNRDARAIHLKLDELIRATKHARNKMIDLESLTDTELDQVHAEFLELHKETEHHLEKIQETRKAKSKSKPINHHRS